MATQNQAPQNNWPNEVKDYVKNIMAGAHTLSGFVPTKVEWTLTEGQICKMIKQHASAFIKDIVTVTLIVNKRTGDMTGFIWMYKNSPDLNDPELRKGESALGRSITRLAPNVKEFMEKYSRKNEKRLVESQVGRRSDIVAIAIDVQNVLDIEFDTRGLNFETTFGSRPKRRIETNYIPNFKNGKFATVTVLKQPPNQTRDWSDVAVPKMSYNA